MAVKRKHEVDVDDILPACKKQMKLIPFPNIPAADDVNMSDPEPLYPELHHIRIPSTSSSTSSDVSSSPASFDELFPSFDVTPLPFFNSDGSVNPDSHNLTYLASHVQVNEHKGLLQPAQSFRHHGNNCSQIPKLRVACSPGINGQRTMWSFCAECGAISMVEPM